MRVGRKLRPATAGIVFTVALFLAGAVPGRASIIAVGSRAALAGNVAIDWGIFGPSGTNIITPSADIPVGPLLVGVSTSFTQLSRHDEGPGYLGSFAPGAHLLTDGGSLSDSFIVHFSTPVEAVGTQIQADPLGPFTGYLTLFSASNAKLGVVTVKGDHTKAEDNSAVFIGARSSAFDISYVSFAVDYPSLPGVFPPIAGGLAINTLDVVARVPEPTTVALLAFGLLCLARARRGRG